MTWTVFTVICLLLNYMDPYPASAIPLLQNTSPSNMVPAEEHNHCLFPGPLAKQLRKADPANVHHQMYISIFKSVGRSPTTPHLGTYMSIAVTSANLEVPQCILLTLLERYDVSLGKCKVFLVQRPFSLLVSLRIFQGM